MAPACRLVAVLIVLVLGASGCGTPDYDAAYTQHLADEAEHQVVEDYCRYGAVSRAQLRGCEFHVTFDDVSRLRTNAARYAFGKLHGCWLPDAGPFCKGPRTSPTYRQVFR